MLSWSLLLCPHGSCQVLLPSSLLLFIGAQDPRISFSIQVYIMTFDPDVKDQEKCHILQEILVNRTPPSCFLTFFLQKGVRNGLLSFSVSLAFKPQNSQEAFHLLSCPWLLLCTFFSCFYPLLGSRVWETYLTHSRYLEKIIWMNVSKKKNHFLRLWFYDFSMYKWSLPLKSLTLLWFTSWLLFSFFKNSH